MSCAVCGLETCEGRCAEAPLSPAERVRQAALKKAEARGAGDTLPDYDDEEEANPEELEASSDELDDKEP